MWSRGLLWPAAGREGSLSGRWGPASLNRFATSMTEAEAIRIERVIAMLAKAARGDLDGRLSVEEGIDALITELEIGINLLFDDLLLSRELSNERQQKIEEQTRHIVEQQRELLDALSTPAILLWAGVIGLPIIGEMDAQRARTITETILFKVVKERATHVILDLTGASKLGPEGGRALLRMNHAISLLGAKCLLTGIAPEAAAAMAALGLDLQGLSSYARLADALAFVLQKKGILCAEEKRVLAADAPKKT